MIDKRDEKIEVYISDNSFEKYLKIQQGILSDPHATPGLTLLNCLLTSLALNSKQSCLDSGRLNGISLLHELLERPACSLNTSPNSALILNLCWVLL